MKKAFYISICFLVSYSLFGQKKEYATSLIPDSLRNGALAVTREEVVNMVITKPGKGKQEVKKVVTVFSDKGKSFQYFIELYDKFRKLEDIEINSYDSLGNFVKRYKRKDLEKVRENDGMTFITDNQYMYGFISTTKYPFTIEYNYTIKYDGILDYPDFYPSETDCAIQRSIYSITVENSNKVRFNPYKCNINPKTETLGNNLRYTFEVQNVKAVSTEANSAKKDVPHVNIAPSFFEMDDMVGNMSSWQELGKWFAALNKPSMNLPTERIEFFKNLVKDAVSETDKIKVLYQYLQQNFRYVGIQLGIGGLKPLPADFVDKKKYGDCKALSNYMQAMLNAVNIKSHYAIINSGVDELPVDKSFTEDAFNHIIVCVPQTNDTIWLECTSRTQTFGKLGPSTENRNAFLITDNGGVLVETPKSKATDHFFHSFTSLKLNEDGSATGIIQMKHDGTFSEIVNTSLFEGDQDSRDHFLYNYYGLKQPDEINIEKKEFPERNYTANLQMKYDKLPEFSTGNKHFLNPRIYKFWNLALPKNEKRMTNYYLSFPRIQSDTTVFELPEGYKVETLPKSKSIKSDLGAYESNYTFDQIKRQVVSTCRIIIAKHIIAASKYQEAAQFFSDVLTEQQQKIVVMKE